MRNDLPPQSSRLAIALTACALALPLASCGNDGPSDAISVVPGATSALSTPSVGTATAAATNAATPSSGTTAAAPAELELYTVGRLTWSLDTDVSEDIRNRITDAMNWTINHTNTLAGYEGHVSVTYHPGTPTRFDRPARGAARNGALARLGHLWRMGKLHGRWPLERGHHQCADQGV